MCTLWINPGHSLLCYDKICTFADMKYIFIVELLIYCLITMDCVDVSQLTEEIAFIMHLKWDAIRHFKCCLPTYIKSIFTGLNIGAACNTLIVDYVLQWTMSDVN